MLSLLVDQLLNPVNHQHTVEEQPNDVHLAIENSILDALKSGPMILCDLPDIVGVSMYHIRTRANSLVKKGLLIKRFVVSETGVSKKRKVMEVALVGHEWTDPLSENDRSLLNQLKVSFYYDQKIDRLIWKPRKQDEFPNLRTYHIWQSRCEYKPAGRSYDSQGLTVWINNSLRRIERLRPYFNQLDPFDSGIIPK